MHRTLLLTALAVVMTTMQAKTIYVATDGNDNAAGTIDAPMATLPAAYKKITNGDTICFRGGTYHVTDEQVMKTDNTYAYVFALEKAGTATRRTCIMGYPGERPVFDFSALQLDGAHRFSAFYLGANYLHLRNFDIVGSRDIPSRNAYRHERDRIASLRTLPCTTAWPLATTRQRVPTTSC